MKTFEVVYRNESDISVERGNCGKRKQLITHSDCACLGLSRLTIENAHAHFHQASFEIYYVLSGEGILWVDRKPFALSPGVSVLIPPGAKHLAESHTRLEVLVVMSPALAEHADIQFAETAEAKCESPMAL